MLSKSITTSLIIGRHFSVPRCAKIIGLQEAWDAALSTRQSHRVMELIAGLKTRLNFLQARTNLLIDRKLVYLRVLHTREAVKLIPDTLHKRQCTFSATHWSLWSKICVTLFLIILRVLWEEDPNAGDPWHRPHGHGEGKWSHLSSNERETVDWRALRWLAV